MTTLQIPYGGRTIHVDMSTANSRGTGFLELVKIKMRKDNISYNQAWEELWNDPKLSHLVDAIKTHGRSFSSSDHPQGQFPGISLAKKSKL